MVAETKIAKSLTLMTLLVNHGKRLAEPCADALGDPKDEKFIYKLTACKIVAEDWPCRGCFWGEVWVLLRDAVLQAWVRNSSKSGLHREEGL